MTGASAPSPPAVVVAERAGSRNFLWGFLAVVFGAALVRGHLGAETDPGRLVVDVVFGALFVGTVAAWVWFNRHPARLEISAEEVTFQHRGQKKSTRLLRSAGDLYVSTTMLGGKHPLRFLKVTGSDEAIALQMFDWPQVQRVCLDNGWRFVEGPGREPQGG
jgi:hypothetical protein